MRLCGAFGLQVLPPFLTVVVQQQHSSPLSATPYSLCCCCVCVCVLLPACACVHPDAALDKAGVWGTPLSKDSPLLSAATLAKLSPAEAAHAPLLAQALLLQHSKRLKASEVALAMLDAVFRP